jgi:hypothetical protein
MCSIFVIKLTIWMTDASVSNLITPRAGEVVEGSLVIEKGMRLANTQIKGGGYTCLCVYFHCAF